MRRCGCISVHQLFKGRCLSASTPVQLTVSASPLPGCTGFVSSTINAYHHTAMHLSCHLGAEAAVVSRGGRMSNRWKSENQDAFLLQLLGNTAGAAGAADAAGTAGTAVQQRPSLLVGVLDGHGVGGQAASRLAAEGIAAELTQRLGSSGSGGSGDGSGSGTPASQQALVQAVQRVAARMQADAAFHEGGAAAVVCLVEHGRWVLVVAGCSGLLCGCQPAAASCLCCLKQLHLLPIFVCSATSRSPAPQHHVRMGGGLPRCGRSEPECTGWAHFCGAPAHAGPQARQVGGGADLGHASCALFPLCSSQGPACVAAF